MSREYFLLLKGFDVMVMPPLRRQIDGLNDDEWRSLRRRVISVMGKVYKQLTGQRAREDPVGNMGMNATRMKTGLFVLQTVGNCACLGPARDRESPSEKGVDFPLEFVLHNTDTPEQMLCLYAGMGALAWWAEQGTIKG